MAITDQLKSLYVKIGGEPTESASTISDWLQKIYLKLGGEAGTGASNIEEWIDKIEDVYMAGGSGSGSTENFVEVEWITAVDAENVTFQYLDGTGPSGTEQLTATINCVSGFSFDTHGGDYDPLVRLTVDGSTKLVGINGYFLSDTELDRGYNISTSSSVYDESTSSWVDATAYYVQIMGLTNPLGSDVKKTYSIKIEVGRFKN